MCQNMFIFVNKVGVSMFFIHYVFYSMLLIEVKIKERTLYKIHLTKNKNQKHKHQISCQVKGMKQWETRSP